MDVEEKLTELAHGCAIEAEHSNFNSDELRYDSNPLCGKFFQEFMWANGFDVSPDGTKVHNERWNSFTKISNLDVATRSKLIKKALSYLFPDQKFSVKSSRYAGGNSIDIKWENGVPSHTVEQTGIASFFGDDYHYVFLERKYSDDVIEQYKTSEWDVDWGELAKTPF